MIQTMQCIDPLTLPGFAAAKHRLESDGRPSYWIMEIVDISNPYAIYQPAGRPNYRSDCPLYDGYWLDGGIGSVQCRGVDELLPGLMWNETCEHKFEQCPFYAVGEVQMSMFADSGGENDGG